MVLKHSAVCIFDVFISLTSTLTITSKLHYVDYVSGSGEVYFTDIIIKLKITKYLVKVKLNILIQD